MTDLSKFEGPWSVGGHPGDSSGTEWREILAPSEFGPMYIGQALGENARRIVECVNDHDGLVAENARLREALEHTAIGLNITASDVARLRDDIPQPLTPEFNRLFAHVVLWYDNLRKAEMTARAALRVTR